MNNRVGLCVSELPQANCTVRQLDAARLLHDFFLGGGNIRLLGEYSPYRCLE